MQNPVHIDFLFSIHCQINSTFLMELFSKNSIIRFFIITVDAPFCKEKGMIFQDFPLLSVVNILLYYSVRNA